MQEINYAAVEGDEKPTVDGKAVQRFSTAERLLHFGWRNKEKWYY